MNKSRFNELDLYRIQRLAIKYQSVLLNRKFYFYYANSKDINLFKLFAHAGNFPHLIGIRPNGTFKAATNGNANFLFYKILNGSVCDEDYEFIHSYRTSKNKIEALNEILDLPYSGGKVSRDKRFLNKFDIANGITIGRKNSCMILKLLPNGLMKPCSVIKFPIHYLKKPSEIIFACFVRNSKKAKGTFCNRFCNSYYYKKISENLHNIGIKFSIQDKIYSKLKK